MSGAHNYRDRLSGTIQSRAAPATEPRHARIQWGRHGNACARPEAWFNPQALAGRRNVHRAERRTGILGVRKKWIANLETAGLSKDLKSGYGGCPTSATACGLFFATPELYQMQELYKSNIDKISSGNTDWFDPAFHEAASRKLYLALDELYYDESEVLLPPYKKLQPIVHAAVESNSGIAREL